MDRRDFIRIVVTGSLAGMACGRGGPERSADGAAAPSRSDLTPVETRETNAVCHALRDGAAVRLPKPRRHVPIVIVGGGPAGLCAARFLDDRPYLLIEKEEQVGGNATGGFWRGVGFSTGASYNNNRDVKALAAELNVPLYPIRSVDGMIVRDIYVPEFFTEGMRRAPYPQRVRDAFRRFVDTYHSYDPEKELERLDNLPFAEILKDYPEEVTAFFDSFGPNNWGAPVADTSAFIGIEAAQWMGGLEPERYAGEAGFGPLAQAVGASVAARGPERLLLGATVARVEAQGDRILVAYVPPGADLDAAAGAASGGSANASGGTPSSAASIWEGPPLPLECVSADTVIVAAPKFIARHLVQGLPPEQQKAMQSIRYEPYMVTNLCFDGVVHEGCFDTNIPAPDVMTDFVCADFPKTHGQGDPKRPTVLSCYMPQRREDRALLLEESEVRASALQALDRIDRWFPGAAGRCREIQVRLRGHPMHASMCGMITRTGPLSRQSLGAIHFAGTDGVGGVSEFAAALESGREAAGRAIASLDAATRRHHRLG
ncbi:MAG TPA: FAD-dependent oxidoreductase [Candidatus Polarisedimenticolia bacterium]|nr:FAD-dependent oxidoreductase [Candidatus Polarisedimenticolia bacterium]